MLSPQAPVSRKMSGPPRYGATEFDGPSSPIRDGWTGREIRPAEEDSPTGAAPTVDGKRTPSSGGHPAGRETWMDFLKSPPPGNTHDGMEPADPPMVDGPSFGIRKRTLADANVNTNANANEAEGTATVSTTDLHLRRAVSSRQPTGRRRPAREVSGANGEGLVQAELLSDLTLDAVETGQRGPATSHE